MSVQGFAALSGGRSPTCSAGCSWGPAAPNGGRFRYPRAGLVAPAGTIVLFQYRARVIASAVFVRDERFERRGAALAGELHLEMASIRTFEPVDAATMRKAWPAFSGVRHVKQALHPGSMRRSGGG